MLVKFVLHSVIKLGVISAKLRIFAESLLPILDFMCLILILEIFWLYVCVAFHSFSWQMMDVYSKNIR